MRIEIDEESGFCFGVVNAIRQAETELERQGHLFCLGDIVHNNNELARLQEKGLVTIDREQFARLHDVKVLLRAHGEPPETYRIARENRIELLDATCPVVLQLQRKIKQAYEEGDLQRDQIVIYGERGHAEVNGLVGQTDGHAVVIEGPADFDRLDFSKRICLYAQTTKSVEGLHALVEALTHRNNGCPPEYHDTICRQVANRIPHIRRFAQQHDLILFVCGQMSSNGKVLFEECRKVNAQSYRVSDLAEIDSAWLQGRQSIGICGATSTPKWLMEEVARHVSTLLEAEV
ncbi:MAG: 4-hydroxy-3-methylbut-2-enyl diphosphate reductase [Porphyromonadaceae bacterium]|nr:4-hydroxy-3-methylbut-2-enyl diphosphate reductase [Porphyromonadaceae bacterium]